MSDKRQAIPTRGLKHSLEKSLIMPKFGNKKRKYIMEMPIQQYLAPGLKDSLFGKLTEDLMFNILCCLSLDDLSKMSMASKSLSEVIYIYTMRRPFSMRVARLLIQHPDPCQLVIDHGFHVGQLLKRISFLFTVELRLQFFHHHIETVQRLIKKESDDLIDTLPFVGSVLQSFIAGWDEGECHKVFKFMSDRLFLNRSILQFVVDLPGTDIDNEMFLRRNLRYLFLDRSVTDYDCAIWIGFISDEIGTAQLANVLILLYAPVDTQGKIDWHFAFHVRAFELHTSVFMKLAKTIGILQLISNWSPSLSLEVLVCMSNVPNCWLLRSFSCILLPLSYVDLNLVVEYFFTLYKTNKVPTASLLMGLTLMILPHFTTSSEGARNGIIIERSWIKQFICKIINNPKLTTKRYVIVKDLWDSVLTLSNDCANAAIRVENAEDDLQQAANTDAMDDFTNIMDAWKDLSVILMSL